MEQNTPKVVILGGPNGAGKTTTAPKVLRGPLGVREFVNADAIALGLSAFEPEGVALAAGRVMLSRLKELATQRVDFAFETTLASRSFVPWLKELIWSGYEFHLVFLWLPNVEAALARVAERVKAGGHSVPEATVGRRYRAGLENFFRFYQPLAASWQFVSNSGRSGARLVAAGSGLTVEEIRLPAIWTRILKEVEGGT